MNNHCFFIILWWMKIFFRACAGCNLRRLLYSSLANWIVLKEDCGGTDRDFFVEKCHQSAGSNSKLIGVLSISEHAFRKLKKQQGSRKVKAMFAQEIFFLWWGITTHTWLVIWVETRGSLIIKINTSSSHYYPLLFCGEMGCCMKSSRTMGESTITRTRKNPLFA